MARFEPHAANARSVGGPFGVCVATCAKGSYCPIGRIERRLFRGGEVDSGRHSGVTRRGFEAPRRVV